MNPIIHEFDVVICGGGPGGSTAALVFENSGLKVAVIEKDNFPREKVCGDGMTSYIPKALNVISPKFREAFDNFKEKMLINDLYVSSYNGQTITVKFPENAFISPRYYFDKFLYDQAKAIPNITYFLDCQIKTVKISDEICSITTNNNETFRSKLLIGCDGASSLIRRQLTNYTMDASVYCASIRTYYDNVKDVKKDTFEVYFSPLYPEGYLWIFPSFDDQVNVGFCLLKMSVNKSKIKLKETIDEIINEDPKLRERFKDAKQFGEVKGWSIPTGYGKYPIYGNRFMLCGDAASLADPLTGEGIGPAIVSGRIAAKHAIKCFEANDFSEKFISTYHLQIEDKFGRMHKKRAKFNKVIFSKKWIINFLIAFFRSENFLVKKILNLSIKIFS